MCNSFVSGSLKVKFISSLMALFSIVFIEYSCISTNLADLLSQMNKLPQYVARFSRKIKRNVAQTIGKPNKRKTQSIFLMKINCTIIFGISMKWYHKFSWLFIFCVAEKVDDPIFANKILEYQFCLLQNIFAK